MWRVVAAAATKNLTTLPKCLNVFRAPWPCCSNFGWWCWHFAGAVMLVASSTQRYLHCPYLRPPRSWWWHYWAIVATWAPRPSIVWSTLRPILCCYCYSAQIDYYCWPSLAIGWSTQLDRLPVSVGPDAVHTMLDDSRETSNAMVAESRAVASDQEMTTAKRALCWMLAEVTAGCCDFAVAPIAIDATVIGDGRQLQRNYLNCGCPANWPMAMPMDACCCGRCNLRNRVLVRTTNGRAYSMRPMLAVAFCDYRMRRRQRRPPVAAAAAALATNNGFWTNSNDGRNEIHSLTCQPTDIYVDDTLCMRCDFSCWLHNRHRFCTRISIARCYTNARKTTKMRTQRKGEKKLKLN